MVNSNTLKTHQENFDAWFSGYLRNLDSLSDDKRRLITALAEEFKKNIENDICEDLKADISNTLDGSFNSSSDTVETFFLKIIKGKKINSDLFSELTKLNPSIFDKLRKSLSYRNDELNDGRKYELNIIISVCVGLSFDYEDCMTLTHLAGYCLRPDPSHRLDLIYHTFLKNTKRLTIDDCNSVLKFFGYTKNKLLGSQNYIKH